MLFCKRALEVWGTMEALVEKQQRKKLLEDEEKRRRKGHYACTKEWPQFSIKYPCNVIYNTSCIHASYKPMD